MMYEKYNFRYNRSLQKLAQEIHSCIQLSSEVLPYLNEIAGLCVLFVSKEFLCEGEEKSEEMDANPVFLNEVHKYMMSYTQSRPPLLNKTIAKRLITDQLHTSFTEEKLDKILYSSEYILMECFELSGNLARAQSRIRITKRYLYNAITGDKELREMMEHIGFNTEILSLP